MTEHAANVVPLAPVPHGRKPPQNLDAEQSLLGGVLLDNAGLDDALDVVSPADFYREAHRKVFEAMLSLSVSQEPIDRVTLKDRLTEIGTYEQVGGEDFIDLLDKVVPSVSNLGFYARIVREKSDLRRAIEAAHAVASEAYEQHDAVEEFLGRAESRFFAIAAGRDRHAFREAKDALPKYLKQLDELYQHRSDVTGIPSGIAALDKVTTGFQKGDLVVIGARPGVGKTSLALACAVEAAKDGGAAAFFSLEMSYDQIRARLMSQLGGIPLHRLRTGGFIESDWPRMNEGAKKLAELDLHINDAKSLSALEMRSKARRLARLLNGRLREIVVDYLGLMPWPEKARTRDEAVGLNAEAMKNLAGELGVPVLLCVQLNRELEKRPHGRPQLSDLRESGSVEAHADVVIFPWRQKDSDDAELIIGKQRNGPSPATARALWVPQLTVYRNHPADERPAQQSLLEPARFREVPPPEHP